LLQTRRVRAQPYQFFTAIDSTFEVSKKLRKNEPIFKAHPQFHLRWR
jgi:hypothetical protein